MWFDPVAEFVLREEFLKGASLREVSIVKRLVMGPSGVHTQPGSDNEDLVCIVPCLVERLCTLVWIFNNIDDIP